MWQLLRDVTPMDRTMKLDIIAFLFEASTFSFNGDVCSHKSDTPMGSPLSSILATMVMDHLLDVCIPRLPFRLAFIYKYVDDIVCSVPACHTSTILDIFNSFSPHLQFTIKAEVEKSVPFLDIRIVRCNDQRILLDWYNKPTFTGRYINFHSNHPLNKKINTPCS